MKEGVVEPLDCKIKCLSMHISDCQKFTKIKKIYMMFQVLQNIYKNIFLNIDIKFNKIQIYFNKLNKIYFLTIVIHWEYVRLS